MQAIQINLVTGLIPLTLLSNKNLPLPSVIGKSDLNDLVNLASDSMALSSSANSELNLERRETIKLDLQNTIKLLCFLQAPITGNLFGDNLPNVMITVKNVSKLIQSLSKSTKYQVLNLPTQIQDCGVTSILDREGFF